MSYPEGAWSQSLLKIEKAALAPLGGQTVEPVVDKVNGTWYVTRTLPSMDPMSAAAIPLVFRLDRDRALSADTTGPLATDDIRVRLTGTDLEPIGKTIAVRCVVADSPDEFFADCREVAKTSRAESPEHRTVLLSDTGGTPVEYANIQLKAMLIVLDQLMELGDDPASP